MGLERRMTLGHPWRVLASSVGMLLGCSEHASRPAENVSKPAPVAPSRSSERGSPAVETSTAPAAPVAASSCSSPEWAQYAGINAYSEIVAGRKLSIRLKQDPSGAWSPAEPLDMPLHHATTIVFEPAIETLLPSTAQRPPRMEIFVYATGLGRRSIAHDPRGVWLVTYGARPECIYVPAGSTGPGDR